MFAKLIQLLPSPPQAPARFVVEQFLNRLFTPAIIEGELDFLEGHVLQAVVTGMALEFGVTLENDKLRVSPASDRWDLRISGNVYDFMLLAARREDADTLFFQRRITTEGNAELGLFVKNFLDAQDMSSLPHSDLFEQAMNKVINVHEILAPLKRALPH